MTLPSTGRRWGRAPTYAVLVVLAVLLALWGAFFVPLRLAGVPVPVGLVFGVGVVLLVTLAGRLTDSRSGCVGVWLCWLLVVLALASRRREGDLVITGSGLQLTYLFLGTIGGAAAVGLWRPAVRASPSATTSRDRAGGVGAG